MGSRRQSLKYPLAGHPWFDKLKMSGFGSNVLNNPETVFQFPWQVTLLQHRPALTFDVIGGAQGQRLDGGGGVDAGAGHEDAAVDDKQV